MELHLKQGTSRAKRVARRDVMSRPWRNDNGEITVQFRRDGDVYTVTASDEEWHQLREDLQWFLDDQ